jgi:hypothetical protein
LIQSSGAVLLSALILSLSHPVPELPEHPTTTNLVLFVDKRVIVFTFSFVDVSLKLDIVYQRLNPIKHLIP